MAIRKHKATTIYPPSNLRTQIDAIASARERPFNYFAVRFMESGLKKFQRQMAKKANPQRT